MNIFKRKREIDYDRLISRLEKGNEMEIRGLLWQPEKKKSIEYLPVTISLIQKLKKIESTNAGLTIHKKIENSKFELIIFYVPWKDSDAPYTPLIIDKSTEKIVGIIHPFNELHTTISNRDSKKISRLGIVWVEFIIGYRFKT